MKFAQTVMALIENIPLIQNLLGHIMKSEAVSVKFTKVPGQHTIVRRQMSCPTGGCAPYQCHGHVR